MKKFIKKYIRIVIILIAIVIIYILFERVNTNGIEKFDKPIMEFIHNFRTIEITKFVIIYTDVIGIYIPIIISIICLVLYKKNTLNIFVPLNLAIITITNQILKIIIARPRPEGALISETGYSFPSGHSMVSSAFYGLLIYYCYEYIKSKKIKTIVISILLLLILLVGYTRIYLGVHYPSDVLAGFALSLVYLPLFTKIIKEDLKYLKRNKKLQIKI